MKTIFEERDLVTVLEAAAYLGLTERTFRQNYSKRLQNVKVFIGKRVFFPKSALGEFLKPKTTQLN